ncbi:MAG TPA: class I SAM-dependent methyltransferase [Candidatus Saccharimonadales bacterium]|nr:class I SAM-dependent methyltransferase [Candidatus Saccharimonadales bacterium]
MKTEVKTIVDEWDLLAERFNTHKSDELAIHPDAAVNIVVGWPVFLEQIKYQCKYLGKSRLDIMDYGCGVGDLCNKLDDMGHHVVGTDKSEVMLGRAKKNSSNDIAFCFTNECSIYEGKMDLVTSMHVLDWIENVDETLLELSKFLRPGGLIIFAVFPKKHVIESLQIKDLFEDFDSETNPTKGVCNFDGIKVPVFVREPRYYDDLFEKMNFDKVLECYPPFPKSFFKKYHWTGAKYPEMVVLAYKKI